MEFCLADDDPSRLPGQQIATRPDRADAGRFGRAPLGPSANALVLLDDGIDYEAVAKVLYLDDDTIRTWHRLYQEDDHRGSCEFGYEGGACGLTGERRELLKAWITKTLPRTTREGGGVLEGFPVFWNVRRPIT